MLKITKTGAAERQLNTAIRLFFENRDHLSSYALAIASRELTNGVIQRQRSDIYRRELARLDDPLKVRLSYWEEMKVHIKNEFHKDFIKLDHKLQNFLKHSGTDPDAEIEPVSAKRLALVILSAVMNYRLLTQDLTIEMKFFFAWFTIAEPQLVNLASIDAMTNKAIAGMLNYVSDDPYGRDTLENIYAAMRLI